MMQKELVLQATGAWINQKWEPISYCFIFFISSFHKTKIELPCLGSSGELGTSLGEHVIVGGENKFYYEESS